MLVQREFSQHFSFGPPRVQRVPTAPLRALPLLSVTLAWDVCVSECVALTVCTYTLMCLLLLLSSPPPFSFSTQLYPPQLATVIPMAP